MPKLSQRDFVSESSDDHFDRETVRKLLNNINTSKSQGPDGLAPKLIYELSEVISEPLTIIFNKSYETGVVPDEWKKGQIIALFKKGRQKKKRKKKRKKKLQIIDRLALLVLVSKIFEKLIKARIIDHMNTNNLFSNKQFGFIGGRSIKLLTVLDK